MKTKMTTIRDGRVTAATNGPVTLIAGDSATATASDRATVDAKETATDLAKEPATAGLRPWAALSVAALMLVAAAAIGVTKARPYFELGERADQRASALAAGRQLAVNFVTMDYRTFDSYSAQVLSGASGPFHDQYAAKLSVLKKVVVANQARSSVQRVEAGLVYADADSAEVIVGLVAPTSNTATPQAVDKTYRLRLDLQRASGADDSWKVTDLDFVE